MLGGTIKVKSTKVPTNQESYHPLLSSSFLDLSTFYSQALRYTILIRHSIGCPFVLLWLLCLHLEDVCDDVCKNDAAIAMALQQLEGSRAGMLPTVARVSREERLRLRNVRLSPFHEHFNQWGSTNLFPQLPSCSSMCCERSVLQDPAPTSMSTTPICLNHPLFFQIPSAPGLLSLDDGEGDLIPQIIIAWFASTWIVWFFPLGTLTFTRTLTLTLTLTLIRSYGDSWTCDT